MAAESLARPARTVPEATRELVLRGIALYVERKEEVEPLGRGKYRVPGLHNGVYVVDLGVFGVGEESCDCKENARPCMHLIAVTIYRAKLKASQRSCRARFSPEQIAANLERMGA